jgi:flagellar motor protein MotB
MPHDRRFAVATPRLAALALAASALFSPLATLAQDSATAAPSLSLAAPANPAGPSSLDQAPTLVAQSGGALGGTAEVESLRQALEDARYELAATQAKLEELQVLAAKAKQSEPVIAEQKQRIKDLNDLTAQLKSQNSGLMSKLNAPRLSLPTQSWSYRVTFASGSVRITSKAKQALRTALQERPVGGCVMVVGSTDDQGIKSGGQVASNAELSALRALRVQGLAQRMDRALLDGSLLLGLSTYVEADLSDDQRRAVVLRWTDQDCGALISLEKPAN